MARTRLLNATTEVPAARTVQEIQTLLSRYRARRLMVQNDHEGRPIAMVFTLMTPQGERGYRLPVKPDAVKRVLNRERSRSVTDHHALDVAWRINLTWLRAQLAILDAEQAAVDEILMPYLVVEGGRTLYEAVLTGQIALPAPKGDG